MNTTTSEPFAQFVTLLAIYSDASNRLEDLENEANAQFLELLDGKTKEYAELQAALTSTENALETMARSNPDWFGDKKSVSTPYGAVKLTKSSKLVIDNPELTTVLLEQEGEKNPEFKAGDYIHTARTPNKEALEKLPASLLKKFRVAVLQDDSFSVAPAKVKMGKAIKEANKSVKSPLAEEATE